MSKGPGAIERCIANLFAATRDRALSVGEIADNAYGLHGRAPTRAQRLSATRAAHRLVRRLKDMSELSLRLSRKCYRDAALGPEPPTPRGYEPDGEWSKYQGKLKAAVEAMPEYQLSRRIRGELERVGEWIRILPTGERGMRMGEFESWRETTGLDGRLYFHPADAPVRVWAVSVQSSGVVWADAEVTRITKRNVMVRYAGEIARLDREGLFHSWVYWRGVRFVSSRSGRAAQWLDEIWQQKFGRTGGVVPPSMRMPLADAMALLGVPENYTREDVIAGFRRAAKRAHPDVGGTEEQFRKLVEARDRLLAAIGTKEPPPKAPRYAPKGWRVAYRRVRLGAPSTKLLR